MVLFKKTQTFSFNEFTVTEQNVNVLCHPFPDRAIITREIRTDLLGAHIACSLFQTPCVKGAS